MGASLHKYPSRLLILKNRKVEYITHGFRLYSGRHVKCIICLKVLVA